MQFFTENFFKILKIHVCNQYNKIKRGYQLEARAHGKGLREGDWKGLEGGNTGGNTVNLFQLEHLQNKI